MYSYNICNQLCNTGWIIIDEVDYLNALEYYIIICMKSAVTDSQYLHRTLKKNFACKSITDLKSCSK